MRPSSSTLAAACAAGLALVAVGGELAAQPGSAAPGPTASAAASPAASSSAADPTGLAGAEDVVVARVAGSPITAGELHRRMALVPPFQLRELGDTPEAIQRAYLDRVLVPELLHVKEAERLELGRRPEVAERINGVLRAALLAEIRREVSETAITDEDVAAYYKANLDRFVSPPRVALWRILVRTEDEAKKLLAELGASPDPKRWADLARERSIDDESKMRGGNLGFVEPDGETSQRGVKVDLALVRAAEGVKEGELVPAPVREGDAWAVVWKRQSLRPVTRSLEAERAGIRQVLAQERMHGAVTELLTTLRSNVTEVHEELVDVVAIDAAGELARALRPGTLPRSKRVARPQPEPGPAGSR